MLLLFDSVPILEEFIVHFVLDESVEDAHAEDVVAFGDFVAHAAHGLKFYDYWLWGFDPAGLYLLVTNPVKQHLFRLVIIWSAFSRYFFEAAFVLKYTRLNFGIELCL